MTHQARGPAALLRHCPTVPLMRCPTAQTMRRCPRRRHAPAAMFAGQRCEREALVATPRAHGIASIPLHHESLMTLLMWILTGLLLLLSLWSLLAVTLSALQVRRLGGTRVGMGVGSQWLIILTVWGLFYMIVALVREPGRYPAWGIALWLLFVIGSVAGWLFGTWIHEEGVSVGGMRADWASISSCRVVPMNSGRGATLQIAASKFVTGPLEVRLSSRQADRARALLARYGRGEGLPAA